MTEKVKHGANGEFLAAIWLMEELGLAAGPYDIQMIAQVIAYAARDSKTDAEAASRALLASAQAAIEAGENVNVFWFEEQEADERKRQDEEEAAYQMYKSMSAAFRKANPHRSWDARLSTARKAE
jgi:nucleoid DNA-binding protein